MIGFHKDYVVKMFSIGGRTAIVTGATGTLGGAITVAYAMCGAKVVLTGRNKGRLEVLAGEIRDTDGEALPYAADPSVGEQVEGLVASVVKQYGNLDILAVSHGYNKPRDILDRSVEDWQYTMDAGLKSVYTVVKYTGEQVARRRRGDKIVVVSSARPKMGMTSYTGYCASKGACDLMIQPLTCGLSAKHNISVNTINLIVFRSELIGWMFDIELEVYRNFLKRLPAGQLDEPLDFVEMVIFLAASVSGFLTGGNYDTTGGYRACQSRGTEQNREEGELNMESIRSILTCGVGVMGESVAFVFSANPGHRITLYDIFPAGVEEGVRINTRQLAEKEILTEEVLTERLSRTPFTSNLDSREVGTADLVIETVFEDTKTGQDIFEALEERLSDDAIFCINPSVMSPSEISSRLRHRERFVGTHFWNLVRLIPLVEVVMSDATSDDMTRIMMEALVLVEKRPVPCRKDMPGFIANWMQHVLWQEAVSTAERGIADAGTVGEVVRHSFDLRLPQLDSMENVDMVGTDLAFNTHDCVLVDLENSHQPFAVLRQLKEDGELGFKTGEGFQTWSEEQRTESTANLSQYLIRMIYGK